MESESDEADVPLPAQNKSKLLLVAVLLNLVGTGVVASKVFMLPDPVTVVEAQPAEGEAERASNAPGPMHELDSLTVNLNETEGTRYLKTTIELEFVNEDALNKMVELNKIVRNELLSYLSGLSFKETIGEEARLVVQKNIAERVNSVLEMEAVSRVLFADFVVQ